MEKLLHERLKEWSETPCPLNTAFDEIVISEYSYDDEVEKLFVSFADEIERYYIQRPRFEDGEPVQFGDEVQSSNGTVSKVEKLIYYDYGTVTACSKMGGGGNCRMDEPFKRPDPKVYDADGVEIKVGDTLYSVSNGNSGVVCDVGDFVTEYSHGEVMLEGCDETYKADLFTHERPVFDADGVRIRKGDTVWRVDDGLEMRVIGVGDEALAESCEVLTEIGGKKPYHYNGKELTHERPVFDAEGVRCKRGETVWDKCGEQHEITLLHPDKEFSVQIENGDCYKASDITHREPDSFEKLRDEIAAWCASNSLATSETRSWGDRLTALIERGA